YLSTSQHCSSRSSDRNYSSYFHHTPTAEIYTLSLHDALPILIAYFILCIAYINYINVATVKSLERAKEVGIRKVLGGFRFQLVAQFLSESLIYNVAAMVIAVVAVYVLLPTF